MNVIICKCGVTALLVVLVLSSAVLIMALSASFLGLGELDLGFTSQRGAEAYTLAEGCMEDTLNNLRRDNTYALTPAPPIPGTIAEQSWGDNTSVGEGCEDATTCTISNFPIGHDEGYDRMVLVGIALEEDDSFPHSTVIDVEIDNTSCIFSASENIKNGENYASLWFCDDNTIPDTSGMYDITVTTDTNGNPGPDDFFIGAMYFTEVLQTGPENVATAPYDGTGPAITSIETFTDGAWLVDVVANRDADDLSVTQTQAPAQEERWNIFNPSLHNAGGAGSTRGPFSPGTHLMGWTGDGGDDYAHVVAAISPGNMPTGGSGGNGGASSGTVQLTFPGSGICDIYIEETDGGTGRLIQVTATSDEFIKHLEATITINADGTITLNTFEEI